jgi:hypothetical protein
VCIAAAGVLVFYWRPLQIHKSVGQIAIGAAQEENSESVCVVALAAANRMQFTIHQQQQQTNKQSKAEKSQECAL